MMTEIRLTRAGKTVVSIQGDVSEDGDLTRLWESLITEFRREFPDASLFDNYTVEWHKVTEEGA